MLDTNILLYALRGELDEPLPVNDVLISVITEIELLGYPGLTGVEEAAVRALIGTLAVIPLSDSVKDEAIRLKRSSRLRLPDALILASAVG